MRVRVCVCHCVSVCVMCVHAYVCQVTVHVRTMYTMCVCVCVHGPSNEAVLYKTVCACMYMYTVCACMYMYTVCACTCKITTVYSNFDHTHTYVILYIHAYMYVRIVQYMHLLDTFVPIHSFSPRQFLYHFKKKTKTKQNHLSIN